MPWNCQRIAQLNPNDSLSNRVTPPHDTHRPEMQQKVRMVKSGRRVNSSLEFLDSGDNVIEFGCRSHDHSGHPVVVPPQGSTISGEGLRASVPGMADARSKSGRSKNIRACRTQSREREESAKARCPASESNRR